MPVLNQLVAELGAGTLKIVDLTQPLGPATPVIGLPPVFASSPGVSLDVISQYNEKGPALVLEHHSDGRAHRDALRRAGPLDHRAGSGGQRVRHDSGAPIRGTCVRD